jgi:CelD/BcsL family acetyltransferase involved in cellulose biosynthesis
VKRIDDARRAHGVPVVEVRADLDAAGHEVARAILHTRSLAADVDSLVPTIKKKTLGSVRKAEREGVTVTRGTEAPDLIEVFYALHLSTRRRQGVPVQPRRFFRLYWDRIIASGLGFVSIARVGSLPIAATVFMASHDTIVYKYAASDRRYGNLGANHLTMWDAIRWGCESGYTTFDFGRTDIGNDGLRAFKSSWGADEEPLVYAAIGEADPSGGRDHVSGVLKKVIQHSPSIVCRGLGEALYKYSA